MPIQLRVIEVMTQRGQGDITVDALSPNEAATIVARAHRLSRTTGSPVIKLPGGQNLLIDRDTPEVAIELILLDETGQEVGPMVVPKPRRGRPKRE